MGEIKKKVRPGEIELHDTELALVVNYEVHGDSFYKPDNAAWLGSSPGSFKQTL